MTTKEPETLPGPSRADDELLTIQEVSEVVRVPVATLRYWRHLGVGPARLPDRPRCPLLADRPYPLARATEHSSTGSTRDSSRVRSTARHDEQMTSIEKRLRDGRVAWRAHYRTSAGAQRNKTFRRKLDAERFLASVESAKNTGTFVDPALARLTVGEWAARWLEGQAHLKPTTRQRYAGIVSKHIQPAWGHVRLSDVSHADVQAWVAGLSETQSPASVRKIHRVLSLILDMAIKDGRLARNAAAKINLPRAVRARAPLPDARSGRGAGSRVRLPTRSQQAQRLRHAGQRHVPGRRPVPRLHRCPVR